jgi:hypothetical protein
VSDVRPWTYAALFGALWGALEATVGTAAYLGRVPFKGALMGIVGLLCLICLRRLQPRPGVCLLAGIVAVFLKVFTLGGFYPGPVIGISVQAVAVEIAMTVFGGRVVGAAVGGFLTLATNPLQNLVMIRVVAGPEAVAASLRALEESASALGLEGVRAVVIVASIVIVTGLVGAAGGIWSWWVAGRVSERLGLRS